MLIDFSIYTLPLAEQNTFKLLLLIPLGALVVVILRNLVGIQTSGTFMPILIALTFLQTRFDLVEPEVTQNRTPEERVAFAQENF